MKRRNVEVGKMRRPMKLKKATEGLYGSTLLYLKFFILWVLVILADFLLEFRFEFLWPFYLLLRSIYDSFKYQGLAFSVFFVCVALTSDMLCFFFIPVHWLFFAASTYVWVQYVWHTDKGICAPTVVLWILFVYLEAAVRLRDVKHLPGHLDLCRPFAAHCIGYPVVTLGFGFKSYIGYRMRQRKQRDVAKENEFYLQLMLQALPADVSSNAPPPTTPVQNNSIANGGTAAAVAAAVVAATTSSQTQSGKHTHHHQHHKVHNGHLAHNGVSNGIHHPPAAAAAATTHNNHRSQRKSVESKVKENNNHNQQQQHHHHHHHHHNQSVVGEHDADVTAKHKTAPDSKHTKVGNGTLVGAAAAAAVEEVAPNPEPEPVAVAVTVVTAATTNRSVNTNKRKERKEQVDKENREAQEYLQKLEQDAKRLRVELQGSRASEQELRLQVATMTTYEKVSRGELLGLQRENDELQCKLQSCNSTKSQDRQTISSLERRLADERRLRMNAEAQLSQERKNRKQEEARAVAMAQAAAAAAAAQQQAQCIRECTEMCKQRRRELEAECANLRSSQNWTDEKITMYERENASLTDKLRDTEIIVVALNAMKDKNQHLENSLSAETRIKLDLFSALGEAKRQLEIKDSCLRAQDKEIDDLKSKIAQVLAVMPNDSFGSPTPSSAMSRVRLTATPNANVATNNVVVAAPDASPGSTLDPNATAYTPKGSLIASTEA